MNTLKKILGVFWMALGPVTIAFLVYEAWRKIAANPVQDVYLPWVIIITIFTPIAIGLTIFGYYALKGEYDNNG
jgi:ABC-type polysaccharide/polyol phosphate export permease